MDLDYKWFWEIADKSGAILMVDMAHFCGLVAAQIMNDPFPYADIVTTTTHKMMRGPWNGMIFMRKKYEEDINYAVFP